MGERLDIPQLPATLRGNGVLFRRIVLSHLDLFLHCLRPLWSKLSLGAGCFARLLFVSYNRMEDNSQQGSVHGRSEPTSQRTDKMNICFVLASDFPQTTGAPSTSGLASSEVAGTSKTEDQSKVQVCPSYLTRRSYGSIPDCNASKPGNTLATETRDWLLLRIYNEANRIAGLISPYGFVFTPLRELMLFLYEADNADIERLEKILRLLRRLSSASVQHFRIQSWFCSLSFRVAAKIGYYLVPIQEGN